MRTSLLGRFALCASAAIAFPTGCGATATTANGRGPLPEIRARASQQNSGSTYKVIKGLLFVALSDPERPYDDVQVYDVGKANPKPLADITDGVSQPQSVCIDGNQTLYVTNGNGGGGWISEYSLGSTSPKTTISQGVDGPTFCAIDSHGNLWVTNRGSVNVTEYLQGSSVPNKVITNGLTYPLGIAIDHAGTMYVANHDGSSDANVQVYRRGQTSPSRTITTGVKWPDGIGVDAAGTLYVTNIIPGNLKEYHPGSSKPYHAITQEMNGPIAITFSPNGWMYVSNLGAQGGGSGPASTILEFPPGSQTPAKKRITQGLYLPGGTAFYPPALP
jgi:streptogramin lyase